MAKAKEIQKPFGTKNISFLLLRLLLSQKHFSFHVISQPVTLAYSPAPALQPDKCPFTTPSSWHAIWAFNVTSSQPQPQHPLRDHSALIGHALTIPPCTLFIYLSSLPSMLYWLLLLIPVHSACVFLVLGGHGQQWGNGDQHHILFPKHQAAFSLWSRSKQRPEQLPQVSKWQKTKPTNPSKPILFYFYCWIRSSKSPQRFEMYFAKRCTRTCIWFHLSPMAPVFLEPLSPSAPLLVTDYLALGTAQSRASQQFPCSLFEPLLWGPADQRREGSQKSTQFTNCEK